MILDTVQFECLNESELCNRPLPLVLNIPLFLAYTF